ncbi:BTAD domain-containing putative transcriptional regulator [Streptomyces sp. NPDC051776]|uniref:BTAD domain-containing putative transcriptional regulator n=1 Tax=Streptomyces sp. NPDC051776 TaxID=3155414 RepID=UPI003442D024
MDFSVLGALEARRDAAMLELGPPMRRALLIRLLLEDGRPVQVERLCEDLWNGVPPAGAVASVHAHVSRLRRLLEPERRRRGEAKILVSEPPGYALRVSPESLDTVRFERGVAASRRALAEGRPERAHDDVVAALALWRGPALADVADYGFAAPEVARLEEAKVAAEELRVAALVGRGEYERAVTAAEQLTERHPLREAAWASLLRALYRSGRAADALQRYDKVRGLLAEDLGLEPGPELRDLQVAILRHDTSILGTRPPLGASATAAQLLGGGTAVSGASALTATASMTKSGTAVSGCPPTRSAADRVAVADSVMVGRGEEMARLRRVLDTARGGRAAWAIISGEAGIGKTRLAQELACMAEDSGFTVAWGRCVEDGDAPPFWPVSQLLRGLGFVGGSSRHDAGPLASLVASVRGERREAGAEAGAGHERFALFDETAGWLAAQVGTRPTLCVIDDLQWADADTLALMTFLARHLHDAPLAMVGTTRDSSAAHYPDFLTTSVRRGGTCIALRALTVRDVQALLPDADEETDTAARLHARTGGNPFYLTELLRLPPKRRLGDGAQLPLSIADALGRRLGRLDPAVRDLVDTAAVMGERLDTELLAHVLGIPLDELSLLVDRAVADGVMAWVCSPGEAGAYAFTHALVRETTLDALPQPRRQRLHAAVARSLQTLCGRHPGETAHHLVAAAPLVPNEEIVDATLEAGRWFAERASYEEAVRWLRHAADAAGSCPHRRSEALCELGIALIRTGRQAEGTDCIVDALDLGLMGTDSDASLEFLVRSADAVTVTHGLWPLLPAGTESLRRLIIPAWSRSWNASTRRPRRSEPGCSTSSPRRCTTRPPRARRGLAPRA